MHAHARKSAHASSLLPAAMLMLTATAGVPAWEGLVDHRVALPLAERRGVVATQAPHTHGPTHRTISRLRSQYCTSTS